MKIKLLTSRAGAGWVQERGQVIEVDNKEAQRMIEAGQAEPVVKRTEKAVKEAGEKR